MKRRDITYRVQRHGNSVVAVIEWPTGVVETRPFSRLDQPIGEVRRRATQWAVDKIDDCSNALERRIAE